MATAATNVHYDLDSRVFERFLDPWMKYSSGLYETDDDTLEQAQVNKLHYICKELQLEPGKKLLDVGCGWGSMSLFAAANYGADVHAMSPAPNQHEYIHQRAAELGLSDRVRTTCGSFPYDIDLAPQSIDASCMVTCIVHMPDLPAVFETHWRALKPGGRLYVSENVYRTRKLYDRFNGRGGTEFAREVFGAGDMRLLTDLLIPAENVGFGILSMRDLTDDYKRTIEAWITNVRRETAAIDAIAPGLSDRLIQYMEIANAGWQYTTKYYSMVFEKRR